MTWPLYLTFIAATTALILLPEPNIMLIVANSIGYGPKRGLATVAGVSAAIAVFLSLITLGMTSLVMTVSHWFEWLRWIGAAYLIYLGVQQWRAPLVTATKAGPQMAFSCAFTQGFIVSATNPNGLLFLPPSCRNSSIPAIRCCHR